MLRSHRIAYTLSLRVWGMTTVIVHSEASIVFFDATAGWNRNTHTCTHIRTHGGKHTRCGFYAKTRFLRYRRRCISFSDYFSFFSFFSSFSVTLHRMHYVMTTLIYGFISLITLHKALFDRQRLSLGWYARLSSPSRDPNDRRLQCSRAHTHTSRRLIASINCAKANNKVWPILFYLILVMPPGQVPPNDLIDVCLLEIHREITRNSFSCCARNSQTISVAVWNEI